MRPLWISIFAVFFISSCYSQCYDYETGYYNCDNSPSSNLSNITGAWFLDWQNQDQDLSMYLPINFTIAQDWYWGYSITYSSPLTTEIGNPSPNYNASGPVTYGLYVEWSYSNFVYLRDNTGQQWTYNTATNTFSLSFKAASQVTGEVSTWNVLYDRNGAYYDHMELMENMTGYWVNPAEYSGTGSCPPSDVSIAPADSGYDFVARFHYYDTVCSIEMAEESILKLVAPSTGALTWESTDFLIVYDPSQPGQITLQGGVTDVQLQKNQDSNMISGTWYLDWQNTQVGSQFPVTLTINNINNSSMLATFIEADSETYSYSLVVPVGEDYYYLPNADLVFSYEYTTNSIMFEPETVLYSPTGSLFSTQPFISTHLWEVNTTANPNQQGCCIPENVVFTPGDSQNSLSVYYYLSPSPNCLSLSQFRPIVSSPLQIETPSVVELTWVDQNGATIEFGSPDANWIQVSNFLGTGCDFEIIPDTL